MKNRLPVDIDNLELPVNDREIINKTTNVSYGYISILYILSLLITGISVAVVIYFGK